MQTITSRKNDLVRAAAALADSVRQRRESGCYLVEGARLCEDAARSGVVLEQLFYTEKAVDKYGAYLAACMAVCPQIYEITQPVADLLAETKSTQGIFAVCRMDAVSHDLQALPVTGRLLAVEHLQDPANLGTILRTAEALGVSGVVLAGDCCDIYTPKVLRASMGAVFRLPFFEADTAVQATQALHERKYRVYAAVPDASAKLITRLSFSDHDAVWIGNEGNGLTKEAIETADAAVTIPMAGRAESLNAAAAASIVMWELCRNLSEELIRG